MKRRPGARDIVVYLDKVNNETEIDMTYTDSDSTAPPQMKFSQ